MTKITVDKALIEQAIEAAFSPYCAQALGILVPALRAALAEVVEPVAWLYDFTIAGDNKVYANWVTQDPTEVGKEVEGISNVRPLYASPPPPAEVPLLSDFEISDVFQKSNKPGSSHGDFARAIEQAARRNAGLK